MSQVVSDVLVYNSITNKLDDEKLDARAPFSLIEFLNYVGAFDKNIEEIKLYDTYLRNWQATTSKVLETINADIKTQFISFLSEVKLVYSTAEEKRYLENINLDNDEELAVAIPFFARKIKEISQYFAKKRKEITRDVRQTKTKGSNEGLKQSIKRELLDIFNNDNVEGLTRPEDIGAFVDSISIEVENQYDTFNDYYDLDPSQPPTFYDVTSNDERFTYQTSNTNVLSGTYFYDTERAIRDIVNEQGIVLKEIPGLLVQYDTTELDNLNDKQFIDYRNSGRGNLKYLLQAELLQNLMGTDMYYLSTNSRSEILSGKMFNAAAPYRNLLNINNASLLQTPGNDFKSEREVGLFYGPRYQGIVKADAAFTPALDKTNLTSDTTYIFPDPNRYGKIQGVGGVCRETPFIFVLKNTEFKNSSSAFGEALVKSDNDSLNFYSYSSVEQDNHTQDNLNPITGITKERINGNILKEEGDIFGNIFYVVDNTSNGREFNITVSSNLQDKETRLKSTVLPRVNESITTKKNKKKHVEVYNVAKDKVESLSAAFSPIFQKYTYNSELYNELNNNILDVNIFKNTFYIKTPNYLVVDNIAFDTTGKFSSKIFVSRVKKYNSKITTEQDRKTISNFSNPVQIGKDVYTIKIESDITTRPINSRTFKIKVFKLDINDQKEINLITENTTNKTFFSQNFTFDIGVNIVQIKSSNLSFNKLQNKFLLVTNFKDLNNSSNIHILIFEQKSNTLIIHENYIITPDNFSTTQNFYKSNVIATNFKTQSLSSTPTQDIKNGTFNF